MGENLRIYTKRNLKHGFFEKFLYNFSVTKQIITANIILFILFTTLLTINSGFIDYIALKPSDVAGGKYLWTFATSMFMHAPAALIFPFSLLSFHLLINMFVLISLGSFCEKIIGRKRFLWFYIIAGLVSGAVFVLLSVFFANFPFWEKVFGSPEIAGVGASGAIFAVAGLLMVLIPKLKFTVIFFPFFSLPAYVMIPLVLFATWGVSAASGLPVGNTAHFGGFLTGVIYGVYLRKKYSKKIKILNRYIG
ncbi:MAG: rhomboid family intramembrane serine protease [Candidatus Pacearchaeota archaeon]